MFSEVVFLLDDELISGCVRRRGKSLLLQPSPAAGSLQPAASAQRYTKQTADYTAEADYATTQVRVVRQ